MDELASPSDEMEIKTSPIKTKLKTKNSNGDLVFFI